MLVFVEILNSLNTEQLFYLVQTCIKHFIKDIFDRYDLNLLLAAKTWLSLIKRNDPFTLADSRAI